MWSVAHAAFSSLYLFPHCPICPPHIFFKLFFLLFVLVHLGLYFCLTSVLLTAISARIYKDSRPVGFSIMFLSVCIVAVLKDVCRPLLFFVHFFFSNTSETLLPQSVSLQLQFFVQLKSEKILITLYTAYNTEYKKNT